MTPPATRLIVALDVPPERADDLVTVLSRETLTSRPADVSFFKVGPALLLDRNGYGVAERIVRLGLGLFLDLKLYDTRDTVDRTVRRAFDLGARFVTVHATPSVMEAAMRAKPADPRCRVLAVKRLTDRVVAEMYLCDAEVRSYGRILNCVDGVVMSAWAVKRFHELLFLLRHCPELQNKTFVSPGIRPRDVAADNHVHTATPAEAIRYGADYLVVGRPITAAPDPVAAARAIITEIEEACSP